MASLINVMTSCKLGQGGGFQLVVETFSESGTSQQKMRLVKSNASFIAAKEVGVLAADIGEFQ